MGAPPTKPRLVAGAPPAQPVAAVLAAVDEEDWQTLRVAEGAQGPRTYQFVAQRVWESREGLPGRACWLVLRRNPDGTEPKADLSNAPAAIPLAHLAEVGARRWAIETAFQQAKGEAGLDDYEVRGWVGWHHHVTLVLLAAAFLRTLQQAWGEKLRGVTVPQVARVRRELLPRRRWSRDEVWDWLVETQARNARANRSHRRRRLSRTSKPSL